MITQDHPDLRSHYTFAYGFKGSGKTISSALSGVAWHSYAWGTDGVLYSPTHGAFTQWDLQQQAIEMFLAVEFGAASAYEARYPEHRGEPRSGPATVSSHIAK